MSTNDNEAVPELGVQTQIDPHGRAALLLVEGPIHGLCENGVLYPNQTVDIA